MEEQDNEPVKSKRDLLVERLSKSHPDEDYSDGEVLAGRVYDDYDEHDRELGGYKERESALSDMFAADPRAADFLTDWRKGEDPVIGLVRRFGPELSDALQNPELADKLAEANKEYVERVAGSNRLEREFEKNFPETQRLFREAVDAGEMTDDEVDDVFERLRTIVTDGMVGIFSRETIDLVAKAIRHDADVADASREGEVRGRNAKIEESLRKSRRGDGTASLDGTNGRVSRERRADSIFGLADMAR